MCSPTPSFPKQCRTCQSVHTVETWGALPHKGYQTDDYERLEYRNCACGSTLAIRLEVYKIDAELVEAR